MSSENEIVNQAGNDEPENETAPPQPDPVLETSEFDGTAVVPEFDAIVEEDDDGWEAWIEANPEEEEVFETPAEAAIELEAVFADQAEADSEALEDLTNAVDEPEPVSEEDEAPAENKTSDDAPQPEAETPHAEAIEEDSDGEKAPEEPVAETPPPPPPKPQKPRKPRRDGLTTANVISYFAPCGRCGYFLTGYRALNGLDDLETAVSESKGGWLSLTWSLEMYDLVLKSYGNRIEANDLHYDGSCSECRRTFIYKTAPSENKPATFRIEIKPRMR